MQGLLEAAHPSGLSARTPSIDPPNPGASTTIEWFGVKGKRHPKA